MINPSLHPLEEALRFVVNAEGRLDARLHGDFSNAMVSQPVTEGFPFGGLLAALCAGSMREGLAITAPLRTLSVQYLASAAYDAPLTFTPRLMRGGRTVIYTSADTTQDGRLTHHSGATWGGDQPGAVLPPVIAVPPARETIDPARTIPGPMAPRFGQYVEYLFEDGPNILGGNEGKPVVIERLWMRIADGLPLDEARLCYLLDALYPPSWTAFRRPPPMTTIDLRYDFLETITPKIAPDGWLFFEFRVLALQNGWTVDDATAWAPDGRPVATSRQRRKILADRSARKDA